MRFVRLLLIVCSTVAGLILGLDKLAIPIIPGQDIGFTVIPVHGVSGTVLRIEKGVGEIECWLRLSGTGWDPTVHQFEATQGRATPLGVAWEDGNVIVTDPQPPGGKKQFTWYAGETITVRSIEGPVRRFEITDWQVYLKDGPPETRLDRLGRRTIQVVLFSLLALGAVAGLFEAFDKLSPAGLTDAADVVRIVSAVIGKVRAEENESHPHTSAYRTYLKEVVIEKRTDGKKVMAALLPDQSDGVRFLAQLGAVVQFKSRLDELINELQVFQNRAT